LVGQEDQIMKTTRLVAAALGCALAGASLATPAAADPYHRGGYGGGYHHHRGFNPGAAAAIGVIGGLALGAAIASQPSYGYGHPVPVYGAPVYAAPPVYDDGCRIIARRRWDPYYGGYVIVRREVCPY
jgi:hypothetical protein